MEFEFSIALTIKILLILLALFIMRAFYLVYSIITSECKLEKCDSMRAVICAGSGGHTTELLRLLSYLKLSKYKPRLYLVADTDLHSQTKIDTFESGISNSVFSISKIPRSRSVNQSYFSSVFSTIRAFISSIPIVYKFKPDIIFCNGPGTCVPICVIVFILRCMLFLDCRIVFVESICRVNTLSLTGKILQFFADIFVVQWPQLKKVCLRSKYFGRLT